MSASEPIFELDAIGECYFAALIYGLRIIAEKEIERGMYSGSTPIDCDALIHFVRRKGDMLVHHMNEEIENGSYVRWSLEETASVAAAASRLFPGVNDFLPSHFRTAQESVLQPARQKKFFAPALIEKLRTIARTGITNPPSHPRPADARQSIVPAPALANIDIPESVTDLLSRQIASTLLALSIKTLELAAERLRTHQALDSTQ